MSLRLGQDVLLFAQSLLAWHVLVSRLWYGILTLVCSCVSANFWETLPGQGLWNHVGMLMRALVTGGGG